MAPIKKAKNKATKIFGQPRTRPMKTANLTSPVPIHLPRETKNIKRKNTPAITTARIGVHISYLVSRIKIPNTKYQIPATNIAG